MTEAKYEKYGGNTSMTDAKYERYLRKMNKYNPQLSIIERLDRMQAVLALDPIQQRVYFVYQEKATFFPYENLKDVDYDLDCDYRSSGSLGGTLLGGLLMGDFGALLGSGLLSSDHTTTYFVFKMFFYKKPSFQLKFRYSKSYEPLLADYDIVKNALYKVILENKRKNERDPYDTSLVQKNEKDVCKSERANGANETDRTKFEENSGKKNTQPITNKQCLILVGIAIAIYLVILGFCAMNYIKTIKDEKQVAASENIAMSIPSRIEGSVEEEESN